MRNPVTGEPSTSISESEYVKPEAHFLDIEVLKDVTADELVYACGNILRSSRYGAISSRIGRVQNTILAVVFSRAEICQFSGTDTGVLRSPDGERASTSRG